MVFHLTSLLVGTGFGVVIAGLIVYLWQQSARAGLSARLREISGERFELLERNERLETEVRELDRRASRLDSELESEKLRRDEERGLLDEAESRLREAFKALSSESLAQNNQQFLHLAESTLSRFHSHAQGDLERRQQVIGDMVGPIRQGLEAVGARVADLEKQRVGAYEALRQQIASLRDSQKELSGETAKLSRALRVPQVRGRWGEMQLKRVVELAGMNAHCDFAEQPHIASEDGQARPDMIVHLPGGRHIVVDAKAPLDAYLAALESDEAGRGDKLKEHARRVRAHVQALGLRDYASKVEGSADFVVMFLPGESFLSAALAHDDELIDLGVACGVVLATPTTLIGLLKSIAYGWRQEAIERNARDIVRLGGELHARLAGLVGHLGDVGGHLGKAVGAYNRTLGNLESRVMPSVRRLESLDVAPASKHIDMPPPQDTATRRADGVALEVYAAEDDEVRSAEAAE
ncbi:MAG: DNA recombination protein RmuC [Geminicoccaceae bacterium]